MSLKNVALLCDASQVASDQFCERWCYKNQVILGVSFLVGVEMVVSPLMAEHNITLTSCIPVDSVVCEAA